ncbi:hypothetical protein Zmor_023935 [Zophobas morio]|uniref:Uncharacterized protein n=1 Tax=Zophobas morio TaxID=2755281 RepID=A0AA38M7Y3_9CUCU|nr:hypothetical protein Zmor_023935 [Zophobas morio]
MGNSFGALLQYFVPELDLASLPADSFGEVQGHSRRYRVLWCSHHDQAIIRDFLRAKRGPRNVEMNAVCLCVVKNVPTTGFDCPCGIPAAASRNVT